MKSKNGNLTYKEKIANMKKSVIEMVTDEVDEETMVKKEGLFKKALCLKIKKRKNSYRPRRR